MALRFDIHLHTRRHSGCSVIDERQLVRTAVRRGLDGLVITDHHYQWPQEELDDLARQAGEPGFALLSAFEYTSCAGDVLIYGLSAEQARQFVPRRRPEEVVHEAHDLGAACIAAHPTRAGLAFEANFDGLPLAGMEVASVNLKPHEQRLAAHLAQSLGVRPTCASDAHRLEDVARYATSFDAPIRTVADLRDALRAGLFAPAAAGAPA